ncbi:MAG: AbrB/MazE/SpoVT family DNA-binding domain-containing protein [Candidatus Saganbacteria bacterium]|nr:AbrB/MazE/SpoVT family DNA-binding domain-containing protein [Candidatus Saganbacteria bacterium]
MTKATVTTKGQIVIPAKMRERLSIRTGTKLYVEENGNEIILKPVTSTYIKEQEGILKTGGKLSRELLRERVKDRKREK